MLIPGESPVRHRSSYRERLALGISRYAASDYDALLAFRHSLDGERRNQYTADLFRWKFERNGCADEDGPPIWVYKKDGRILGQQAGITVALQVGIHTYRGSWAIDLLVHPEYRLRGIGAVLSETSIKDHDVTLGMGITDDAYRAYLRAGWIDLGTVPLFVRPLNVGKMLGSRWRPRLGPWLGHALNFPLRVADLWARTSFGRVSARLEEIERFDERVDELWRCAAAHYPVICQRDSSYLNWRFAAFPWKERYRLFYVLCKQDVVGYAVLRMGSRHGLVVGDIVDYLCEPSWTTKLFAACLEQFRRWGATAAYCLHAAPHASRALRRLGFFLRESGTRLMVKPTRVGEQDVHLLRNRENWFVTVGDGDVDYAGRQMPAERADSVGCIA